MPCPVLLLRNKKLKYVPGFFKITKFDGTFFNENLILSGKHPATGGTGIACLGDAQQTVFERKQILEEILQNCGCAGITPMQRKYTKCEKCIASDPVLHYNNNSMRPVRGENEGSL